MNQIIGAQMREDLKAVDCNDCPFSSYGKYSCDSSCKIKSQIQEAYDCLPDVEVGDRVYLGDVWDGNGEVPESSYSYQVGPVTWINYVFNLLAQAPSSADICESIVEIVDIEVI